MRVVAITGAASVIGGVPLACLVLLLLTHSVATGPALVVISVIVAYAALLGLVWVRDMDALTNTLREAVLENELALSHAAASPRLPAVERVARGIERLARAHAARAAEIGALLRANIGIVEHLPDPLLVLGADHGVRRANAAARNVLGEEMAAVLRHPGMREAIERAFAQCSNQTAELSLPVPTPREVQASVIFLDPPLADGGHAIAVLSDRTRDRAVERMRADFVANASHELRTPLASLMGFIETLRGPAADDAPAQKRFLGIMAEQAERMNRLIDDLLSLSRIELTEHQPPSEVVNLAEIIESIAAGFEPRLAARRVKLELQIEPDMPCIIADADQLAQVLSNLVDNAVKYGREGGVVKLHVRKPSPGGRWPTRPGVVLSVTDDGPGIPRSEVPRLTERFYRVDKSRSRAAPTGTGLGLSIVKHIVNRHRGQLVIESEEGSGTSFNVWLPLGTER
ncbi:MAG TPA: ATP-binding protein [Acetobacteraceae bacterium]|jgi:two-component system phosphate regulon sensor histidine kinase PhoR